MKKILSRNIILTFAGLEDMETIYEMLVSKETASWMFNEENPAPTWASFFESEERYFPGEASRDGAYLMIEFGMDIIGSISYACGYEKIPYAELDIWMRSKKYTGRGLGTEAIQTLIDFIHKRYAITTFIIRPWVKNQGAIKAYKKCGFIEDENFRIQDYYNDQMMEAYGNGDYGQVETVNLVKRMD